jgi:release factor glutamine methyltransferase
MNSTQTIIDKAAQQLRAFATNPQREARLLAAHVLKTSYEDIFFKNDRFLTNDEKTLFNALLQRRLNHEPISKIIGYREFWSLPFRVTKDTLDPRPDSETLIEAVLRAYPDKTQRLRILDLGTGTGCLLLSLLHEYPNAWGLGVDRSEAASSIAQENAIRLNLKNRCSFIVGNWGDALATSFDIIISNPPYIGNNEPLSPEVVNYDPPMALFAGDDGLNDYRALANQLPKLTTPDSTVFLEMGAGQFNAIRAIFSFAFSIRATLDLKGRERCIVFQIPNERYEKT